MNHLSYELTGDPKRPAVIRRGEASTPVWIQQLWEEGEFARYICANGCGHCCTAMAACLQGVRIDPYEEYMLCRSLWGAPKEEPEERGEHHFLSVAGMQKVLSSLGISAQCYEVKEQGTGRAADHILQALQQGKLVSFVSSPDDYPENPFSPGYHYVLAVGITQTGKILIANSSQRGCAEGVQLTERQTIEKALFRTGTADPGMTWGRLDPLDRGCGYVVIG